MIKKNIGISIKITKIERAILDEVLDNYFLGNKTKNIVKNFKLYDYTVKTKSDLSKLNNKLFFALKKLYVVTLNKYFFSF